MLDEPTAALDPKAEAEVYRRFGEMTKSKASVMISHRLGAARAADLILVLKGGQIVEQGTHEALDAARRRVQPLVQPTSAVVRIKASAVGLSGVCRAGARGGGRPFLGRPCQGP